MLTVRLTHLPLRRGAARGVSGESSRAPRGRRPAAGGPPGGLGADRGHAEHSLAASNAPVHALRRSRSCFGILGFEAASGKAVSPTSPCSPMLLSTLAWPAVAAAASAAWPPQDRIELATRTGSGWREDSGSGGHGFSRARTPRPTSVQARSCGDKPSLSLCPRATVSARKGAPETTTMQRGNWARHATLCRDSGKEEPRAHAAPQKRAPVGARSKRVRGSGRADRALGLSAETERTD
ncbi:hypothetical protein HPB47_025535 [Ixodes persulcatus]|uniref:Uncharacterized protein n=1 Tax=Ixodes persulcatus TaxID=34615 RepID=A0AC60Q320_IXOPE|nr:hypothetical protein HPB47_025535 [Ixodes persulcatus]